ncbi:MAG: site-2 protease family protein [Acidimicrobiales bacterium]
MTDGPSGPPHGRGGAYYYPPGATPGGTPRRDLPPRRPAPASLRRWIWFAIALGFAILFVGSLKISRDDVVLFCVLVPSIILHEIAHGCVALVFGDDTAKRAGRLTLNPLAHVDLVGTIILPLILIWGGFGFFGWAKPVPVDVGRLRSPRNHGVLVSLAGPATNVVLVVISAVAFHVLGGVSAIETPPKPALWALILFYLGLVNVWLTVFNLIPLPPLDGSVLLERLLPSSWWPAYLQFRRFTLPLVIAGVVIASIVRIGDTSAIGRLSNGTENWWLSVLGVT